MDWQTLPSLAALRAFDALARTGSLSAAGRLLNVTHAAIAQHLRALETHFGVPLATRDGQEHRLAVGGPRAFALLNLNTESPTLPALALRGDVSMPVGNAAGSRALASLKGIATRSWGTWRAHLNGTRTFGRAADAPTVDAPARWVASLAVDHTFWRQSLLVIGEVAAQESLAGGSTGWLAGIGARWQATPALVLDAGVYRRLSPVGPDLGLTLGASRTLGLGGLGRWGQR